MKGKRYCILGEFVWNTDRDWVHVYGSRRVYACISCGSKLKPGDYSICSSCWVFATRMKRPQGALRLPTKKEFREKGEFTDLLPVTRK